MARIRSIKPEFFTSEVIASLPLSARLTFIGLWTYVDDNGVGLDNERLILAAVWPLEDEPSRFWPLAGRLNGEIHLIAGNHDAAWPGHRDSFKHQREWLDHFASVQPFARRRIEGQDVMLSHFPYAGDHTDEDRFVQYRLRDTGGWLIHGHTHGTRKVSGKMIHVGLDAHDLKPVPMSWVQKVIRDATSITCPA